MESAAVPVLVALAAGVALGVVVNRIGAGTTDGLAALATDPRSWLVLSAVLAVSTRGPLVGAAAGLAAMLGLLLTLQVLPWEADPAGAPRELATAYARALRRAFEQGAWLDPALLAGAALAGAAIGTIRLVLRTGRRIGLVVAAVVVVIVVVAGVPDLSDIPSHPDGVAVIR